MIGQSSKFIIFLIFSLIVVNFSTNTILEFFNVDTAQVTPFLMYINIMGFFVIVLPKNTGSIVEKLNKIIKKN